MIGLDNLDIIYYNAPITLTYATISLTALILGKITRGASDGLFFSVYKSSPFSLLTYIRLIGHIFGHANIQHYFINFMLILLISPMLEYRYGSLYLLIMILITAAVTGLLFIIFSKRGTAAMGASGVVFMMILLGSFINVEQGNIPITLIIVAIMYIGKEFIGEAAKIFKTENNGVAHAMHIFGGLCGAAFGVYLYLM